MMATVVDIFDPVEVPPLTQQVALSCHCLPRPARYGRRYRLSVFLSFSLDAEGLLDSFPDMEAPVLRILTVHGTWARGIDAPPASPDSPAPKWCRPESPFMRRLCGGFYESGFNFDVEHFLWSGGNAVLERAAAAQKLAETLMQRIDERPADEQLIIGHSHGGNVVLRAMHLLRSNSTLEEDAVSRISVVTIATPFLSVTTARLSLYKILTSLNLLVLPLLALAVLVHTPLDQSLQITSATKVAAVLLLIYLLVFCLTTPEWDTRAQPDDLVRESYYPAYDGEFRLKIIRGVEDEASMALMLSVINNRITDIILSILCTCLLLSLLCLAIVVLSDMLGDIPRYAIELGVTISSTEKFCLLLSSWWAIGFVASAVSRSFFGLEFLLTPYSIVASAQSVPDLAQLATVVTLSRQDQADFSILHSLYNHPSCAGEIVNWMTSRLDTRLS